MSLEVVPESAFAPWLASLLDAYKIVGPTALADGCYSFKETTAPDQLALEMLVRAYDPCISYSTHLLDVKLE